jgi:hypothetical protein
VLNLTFLGIFESGDDAGVCFKDAFTQLTDIIHEIIIKLFMGSANTSIGRGKVRGNSLGSAAQPLPVSRHSSSYQGTAQMTAQ